MMGTSTQPANPEMGASQGVVYAQDSSEQAFGIKDIEWLKTSDVDSCRAWMERLTKGQLQGLIQKVGQCLVETSKSVQEKIHEHSSLEDTLCYAALGVGPESTEKEIEKAYRQLAKQMHPDKNGGTDEAKLQFQCMKERYEALKRKRAPTPSELSDDAAQQPEPDAPSKSGGEGSEDKEPLSQADGEPAPPTEAYHEDVQDRQKRESPSEPSKITYDPNDCESIKQTMWKMLSNLKGLDKKLDSLDGDLKQLKQEAALKQQ